MSTEQPPAPRVELTLTPRLDDDRLRLELAFRNRGAIEVWIEKYNACANRRVEQNVFRVVDEDGGRVPYAGPMFKRGRAGRDDYILIAAGDTFTVAVNLAEGYRLRPGAHTYRVSYSSMISYPDRDGLWSLDSANKAVARVTAG